MYCCVLFRKSERGTAVGVDFHKFPTTTIRDGWIKAARHQGSFYLFGNVYETVLQLFHVSDVLDFRYHDGDMGGGGGAVVSVRVFAVCSSQMITIAQDLN